MGELVTVSEVEQAWSDELESGVVSTLQSRPGVRVVTWDTLRSAGMADLQYVKLLSFLGSRDGILDDSIMELEKHVGGGWRCASGKSGLCAPVLAW